MLASSGLDALSQLIEPFLSRRANPLTDALAREGIRARGALAARARCRTAGTRRRRRSRSLALASLLGGLCLANAGLGAVHGFAAPARRACSTRRTARSAPRCCRAVLASTCARCAARAPEHPALARFDELAALLTGRPDATAEDAVAWVATLCRALAIPGLARYGMTRRGLPALVAQGPRGQQHEGQPDRPHRRGADGDRDGVAVSVRARQTPRLATCSRMIASASSGTISQTICSMISRDSFAMASYSGPRRRMPPASDRPTR